MFKRVLVYFPLLFRFSSGFFPFRDPIREALSLCEPLFSMSSLGFGLWASSGPFPLLAHYGLYKTGRDPPTNPSRHLKKQRSDLPLKWLLKEGRGRSPTAAAAARLRAIAGAATTTAATPCPGHGSSPPSPRLRHHRDSAILKPPLPPPPQAATAAASGPLCRHPLHLHPPFLLHPAAPPMPHSPLTRRNCEVIDFTRYHVKNNTELTNLMKTNRIQGYNDKYGSNPQGIKEFFEVIFKFDQIEREIDGRNWAK